MSNYPIRVAAHRITITAGQYAHEIQSFVSLDAWGGDTDRYEAFDESITVELREGAAVIAASAETETFILVRHNDKDDHYSLAEAIDLGIARETKDA